MRRSSALTFLLVAVLATTATTVYNWPQLRIALAARYMSRDQPKLWKTPVPLPDVSISPTPHKKISYLGYEIELPWDDVTLEKDFPDTNAHVVFSGSGNSVTLSAGDLVEQLIAARKRKDAPRQNPALQTMQYSYDFRREILEMTPAKISPFMSREDASRDFSLLFMKMLSPDVDAEIYELQTPYFRGFQFEGPRTRPFTVVDDLYAPDGMLELRFFQRGPGLAPVLTQPEINRVLQSIHKVPTPSPAPTRESRP